MAFKSGAGKTIGEINITPLVDVMLVLLVVFMVTTPIIVEEVTPRKVEVNLPTTDATPVKREDLKRPLHRGKERGLLRSTDPARNIDGLFDDGQAIFCHLRCGPGDGLSELGAPRDAMTDRVAQLDQFVV